MHLSSREWGPKSSPEPHLHQQGDTFSSGRLAIFTLVKGLLLIEVGIGLAGMDGLAALEFRLSVWWLGWACFL